MNNLLRRPSRASDVDQKGKFEKFNLTENPFPSAPTVNNLSDDKRINGDIFETEIRKKEYEQVEENFLKQANSNPNHVRLGYIMELGYVGRGNGKSAFLVNLQRKINRDYCLDISNEVNKCFAVYLLPKPQGQDKTFGNFTDLIFQAILESTIINNCLAILRYEAISHVYPEHNALQDSSDSNLVVNLNSAKWYEAQGLDPRRIMDHVYKNEYLQQMSPDFPLYGNRNQLFMDIVTQEDFANYYNLDILKKPNERLEFVFTDLVRFFQAAGFNGAYILVDDFERIIEFQTAQKQFDFALQLRACVFDGNYSSAKYGFYNFLIVLHAGVQRMMNTAWTKSGMDHRVPIAPSGASKHIIEFEKLNPQHAILLVEKYLSEYRITSATVMNQPLFPFTQEAVRVIGEKSEYNASRILKMAYMLLDKAADENQDIIDEDFVSAMREGQENSSERGASTLEGAESVDLMKQAGEIN